MAFIVIYHSHLSLTQNFIKELPRQFGKIITPRQGNRSTAEDREQSRAIPPHRTTMWLAYWGETRIDSGVPQNDVLRGKRPGEGQRSRERSALYSQHHPSYRGRPGLHRCVNASPPPSYDNAQAAAPSTNLYPDLESKEEDKQTNGRSGGGTPKGLVKRN